MLQDIQKHSLNIVTNAYKHCKNSYWWRDSLNISLHYSIMQHFVRSKKIMIFFNLKMGIHQKYPRINIH
jgi:hypothetical protein